MPARLGRGDDGLPGGLASWTSSALPVWSLARILSCSERSLSERPSGLWRSLGDALSEAGDALGSLHAYDKALGMVGMPRRSRSRMRHLINS